MSEASWEDAFLHREPHRLSFMRCEMPPRRGDEVEFRWASDRQTSGISRTELHRSSHSISNVNRFKEKR